MAKQILLVLHHLRTVYVFSLYFKPCIHAATLTFLKLFILNDNDIFMMFCSFAMKKKHNL